MARNTGWWLAGDADAVVAQKRGTGWIKRFDPRFWTVNFPRPMMAAVTTTAAQALRVDAVFYRTDDLAGLIWASADTVDHPLLRYETAGDYRGCMAGCAGSTAPMPGSRPRSRRRTGRR